MVKSVRLACLMCAASVYPEPGSNSLVFGIYILPFGLYKSNLSVFQALKLLAFLLAKKLLKNLTCSVRYFHIYRFGLFFKGFYCLLFNVLCCSLFFLLGTFCIILYLFFFVNTFSTFF